MAGKICPPLNIYAPKPRKRVPLLCPVPFCPNAFLIGWEGGDTLMKYSLIGRA